MWHSLRLQIQQLLRVAKKINSFLTEMQRYRGVRVNPKRPKTPRRMAQGRKKIPPASSQVVGSAAALMWHSLRLQIQQLLRVAKKINSFLTEMQRYRGVRVNPKRPKTPRYLCISVKK